MRLIDIEAPCKIEIELYGEKCHATVTAPTIDAAPVVHGEWEWNTNNGFYYCSNCKTVSPREDQDGEYCDCPNYCPGCGAKMEGGKDDGVDS